MWLCKINGDRGKRVKNYEKKNQRDIKKFWKQKSEKKVSFKDAIELVKKNSSAKFDEMIDLNLRINLKQSKGGDFNLRTVLKLPNGNGKNKNSSFV